MPETPPAPADPIAAPVVSSNDVAMLFTSYLYGRAADGTLYAMDDISDEDPAWSPATDEWEVGLWFVPPGSADARLLVAPTGGMVYPLALSAAGDRAAVWWHPSRRAARLHGCPGGIYVVSTSGGGSAMVTGKAWAYDAESFDQPGDDPVSFDWIESYYLGLPQASFSSDGRHLALIEPEEIVIYGPEGRLRERHVGACTDWAWSPDGATFIAGCEGMTSAWIVRAGANYATEQFALPLPEHDLAVRGWHRANAATIGFTSDGDVRLVRFYGAAVDCCIAESPAYSVTTIDADTLDMRSTARPVDWLVSTDSWEFDTRLAADGSWVYANLVYDGSKARAIELESGAISAVRGLRARGLSTPDGAYLFGFRADALTGRVTVAAIAGSGMIRDVGTIDWPEGAVSEYPVIETLGLSVVMPAS